MANFTDNIDWGSIAQKYAPAAIGAGLGVGAVGVHDVLQDEEADKQETTGSKVLKYLTGAGIGAVGGHGAGMLYDKYGPKAISREAKRKGLPVTMESPREALRKQYGTRKGLEQSLADAKAYQAQSKNKVLMDLTKIDTKVPTVRHGLGELEAAGFPGVTMKGTKGMFRPNILTPGGEIAYKGDTPSINSQAHELRHAMQGINSPEKAMSIKRRTDELRNIFDISYADMAGAAHDHRDPKGSIAYSIIAPFEREERLGEFKAFLSNAGGIRIQNEKDALKWLKVMPRMVLDEDVTKQYQGIGDLQDAYKSLKTPEDQEQFLKVLAEELPGVVSTDKVDIMNKQADLTGEDNTVISLVPGGPGSQTTEMIDQRKQDADIPKRQGMGKSTTKSYNSQPKTEMAKIAFMKGYLNKIAAAYTGPMGNPGPLPPMQTSPAQLYNETNSHGMGASTLQTVPSLKAPDPAMQAAAEVGGAKSAKPFSGVSADRKTSTNANGASTMNSSTGMGISSTQSYK